MFLSRHINPTCKYDKFGYTNDDNKALHYYYQRVSRRESPRPRAVITVIIARDVITGDDTQIPEDLGKDSVIDASKYAIRIGKLYSFIWKKHDETFIVPKIAKFANATYPEIKVSDHG